MPGFELDPLRETVNQPEYGQQAVEAGLWTLAHDQESGYTVNQDQNGVVTFSEVIHPDTEYLEAMDAAEAMARGMKPQELLVSILRMLDGSSEPVGMPELSLGRLIMADEGGMRTDLAIINHTHPTTHLGRRQLLELDKILLPSRRDIAHFADRAASNDGLIEGVQVTNPETRAGKKEELIIWQLLWRITEPDALQRIQGREGASAVTLRGLAELGLSTTLLGLDLNGRVRHGMRHLSRLYEQPDPLTLPELRRLVS